ncbi:hypothetical protein [Rubrolithibacter danxiaensis]
MKKIVAILLAAFTVGMVSCKKETEVKPSAAKTQKIMGGGKQDMGGWD